eukprot:13257341-Heterocapsa_arctica.AAC.1
MSTTRRPGRRSRPGSHRVANEARKSARPHHRTTPTTTPPNPRKGITGRGAGAPSGVTRDPDRRTQG